MKTSKSFKRVMTLAAMMAAASFMFSPAIGKQNKKADKWVAPETAKKMKNPTTSSKDNVDQGKALYAKHCKSCHGAAGKGDGPKSKEIEVKIPSFSDAAFTSQTDGEIFWKTKEGKDDMPAFKKKISNDEDIWMIVDYVRTLK